MNITLENQFRAKLQFIVFKSLKIVHLVKYLYYNLYYRKINDQVVNFKN